MKRRFVILLVAALPLAVALGDGSRGLPAWWRLRSDLADAQQRVARLQSQIAELRREAAALESDPLTLERAIREDLELARPGDVVVRVSPLRPGQATRGNH